MWTKYRNFAAMRFYITPDFHISTDLLRLTLTVKPGLTAAQLNAHPGEAHIALPEGLNFDQAAVQEWLNRVVVEALRKQCHWLLTPRIHHLAQQGGLSFGRITYKDVRSRWGSCSSLRNLNFSVWLLLAPARWVDYVVAHELAHLSHLNHSPRFWAEADRLLGAPGLARCLDREMNAFARSLRGRLR